MGDNKIICQNAGSQCFSEVRDFHLMLEFRWANFSLT